MENQKATLEPWLKEFENRFKDAFSRNNPVVQVKGHHEKEYLHKTYPAVMRFHPSGDVTIHPAKYESSNVVSEGAVDVRDVYVTEKQWKMDEAIKEFISQAIATAVSNREKEIAEEIKRRKGDDDAYPIWNDTLDDIVSFILNHK